MNSCGKQKNKCDKRGFIPSVSAALEGVVHTLQAEQNMRLHFLVGFLAVIVGIYFNFTSSELMFLCFAVTFVLVAEMFNTALERITDLLSDKYDLAVKVIKDIAAGAVFVSSVNAAVVGYILLYKRFSGCSGRTFFTIKQSPWHITLIALVAVIGLVLLIKIVRKEKNLLSGGMPSGHSAVAFSVWIAVSMITENVAVSLLVFFLAVLVARSRMVLKIHSLWQVIVGGVLGVLVTLMLFQFLA